MTPVKTGHADDGAVVVVDGGASVVVVVVFCGLAGWVVGVDWGGAVVDGLGANVGVVSDGAVSGTAVVGGVDVDVVVA